MRRNGDLSTAPSAQDISAAAAPRCTEPTAATANLNVFDSLLTHIGDVTVPLSNTEEACVAPESRRDRVADMST